MTSWQAALRPIELLIGAEEMERWICCWLLSRVRDGGRGFRAKTFFSSRKRTKTAEDFKARIPRLENDTDIIHLPSSKIPQELLSTVV